MSYDQYVREHRRLTILRVLAQAPSFKANDSILTDSANALGVASARAQVRTELQWLKEQGLLAVEMLGDLMIAVLSEHGADVAAGRATVPGVKRPSPDSKV